LDNLFDRFVRQQITEPGYWQNRDNPAWWVDIRTNSTWALCGSGLWFVLFGILFFLLKQGVEKMVALLAILVVADLMLFALPLVRYYPREHMEYTSMVRFVKEHPGDTRNLNLVHKTVDIMLKAEGIWGYESMELRRLSELVASGQTGNDMGFGIMQNTNLYKLLRGRYAFVPTRNGTQVIILQKDVLPRFLVVGNYRVMKGRDEILKTLNQPNFDFRKEVILEQPPGFEISIQSPKYAVEVLSSKYDRWVIEVETDAPGVLMMTDSYAKGWRAQALAGSVQDHYELQPADWAVRGVPLTVVGKHLLEIKYTPPGFALGLWISSLTMLALAGLAAFRWWRHRPAPWL
jgi:hypothetical protein